MLDRVTRPFQRRLLRTISSLVPGISISPTSCRLLGVGLSAFITFSSLSLVALVLARPFLVTLSPSKVVLLLASYLDRCFQSPWLLVKELLLEYRQCPTNELR